MPEIFSKVALVAPVHNRRETTLQALQSLARIKTEGLDVRIFIVDDGSIDGTAEAIRNRYPEVVLITGDGSLHYAAGTNRGIEKALEWNADFVVAMNDDAIFHEKFLVRLIGTARSNPRSIIGALLLLWDEPHRVFQIDPKWNTSAGGWTFTDDLTKFALPTDPFKVECIVGNCVLFPAEAIREIGLMDEHHFPHGWGDAQYTVKMKKAGWQLLVDPNAFVWCEPNTYPKPLHDLSKAEILKTLLLNERHPLNLKRQFVARWYSAPSRISAVISFAFYLANLIGKTMNYGFRRQPNSVKTV